MAVEPFAKIDVKGVDAAMATLKELPRDVQLLIRRDMRSTGKKVAGVVSDAYPQSPPMSNWTRKGRLAWTGPTVKAGVSLRVSKPGRRFPILKVGVYSAPHVIAEVARTGHSEQGVQFVENLDNRGSHQRWARPAFRSQLGKVQAAVENAVRQVEQAASKELS